MITLDSVKRQIRLENDDEDVYLTFLIGVATEYVTGITTVANDVDAPFTYDMACLLLIAHWYANREAVSTGNLTNIPFGVPILLQQLRPAEGMF